MRARYYSPAMRRFINADIIHGEISDSTSLNRYSYVNGNPVSYVDPFGLAVEERGNSTTKSKSQNTIVNYVKDFVKMGGSILESAWIVVSGIKFKAGVGAGLRGSIDLSGVSASLGGKVDLLTFKSAYNEMDIGQEALFGAGISFADLDWLSFDFNEGYYESFVDGNVIEYDYMEPEATIKIIGIDLYLIIGANASVEYNYSDVLNRLYNVWDYWF